MRALGCGNDVSVELSDVGRGWRAGPHAIRPRRRAAALFTALSDPSCWEHIPRPIPSNASELRDQIAAKLDGHRLTFTIRIDEQVIGTTSIIDVDDPQGVEIGATQLSTGAWGTGVNRRVKRLLIAALFASGVQLGSVSNGRAQCPVLSRHPFPRCGGFGYSSGHDHPSRRVYSFQCVLPPAPPHLIVTPQRHR